MRYSAATMMAFATVVAAMMASSSETCTTLAFQQPSRKLLKPHHNTGSTVDMRASIIQLSMQQKDGNHGADDDGKDNHSNDNKPRRQTRSKFRRFVSRLKRPIALMIPVISAASSVAGVATVSPRVAHAGAPVMAIPKTKAQDPVQNAFDLHNKKLMQEAQKELSEFTSEARRIEREQGPEARAEFEKEYKIKQEQKAEENKKGLLQLKYDLLDQGIDPNLDIEGKRQIILYERGVDLGDVAGTPFYLEKQYEQRSPEKSFAYKKKPNREIIKCMAQDLKNRGLDPLDYFLKHQDRTEQILGLPYAKASAIAAQYQENIEKYGQISPPKEGEKSAKEQMTEKGQVVAASKAGKAEAKRLKNEAKAKAAAVKAEAKAAAKQAKDAAKAAAAEAKAAAKVEEERLAKEAKDGKDSAKAAAAAVSSAAAGVISAAPGSLGGGPDVDTSSSAPSSDGGSDEGSTSSSSTDSDSYDFGDSSAGSEIATMTSSSDAAEKKDMLGGLKIVPAASLLVAVGGGVYAVKTVRDRSAAAEEERQRNFKLLMGEFENDVEEEVKDQKSMSDLMFDYENMTETDDDVDEPKAKASSEAPQPIAPKKKKKGGFKSVFGRRKNTRETDLAVLVASDAKAPEFAAVLAKLLTFGAPGRFPQVLSLPGGMPLENFDDETAASIIFSEKEDSGLTDVEAAEVMANVVNCMLIDIVDLASTSLKEKDSKVTVDALSIVVDFMNHAANLFKAIAEGLRVDPPVTYGGDVSKGKLEQMYSEYASSGLTNFASMDEEFESKCDLLRFVFGINEKKAEGLMMKALQKNMMEMMKSGEVPEGMEDMMKGMEGMGLPGMDGEELDHEQTKQMLLQVKAMKDAGQIPDDQLVEVQKQFEEMYGQNLEKMMSGASEEELTPEEKELMELMKGILD
eukprot:CAMPEP_0113501986 /NCGR_PEP_ID=MMETSP0014_2-20120614/33284_1 /TAXON_ID=2857 /ORGANISM="Nitzschia sp." /LENGTH=908 /DNA_ID=CAMNT_0000396685 /DNA_START=108 /DNA_END=2834 /DNA_ORIENTATION=+ /assembly_acc=CAM_ASM_000159